MIKGTGTMATERQIKAANAVGTAIVLFLGLSLVFGVAADFLGDYLSLYGLKGSPPVWFRDMVRILMPLCTFFPVLCYLFYTGRSLGIRPNLRGGELPAPMLMALFAGICIGINAVASLLQNRLAAGLGVRIVQQAVVPQELSSRIIFFITSCVLAAVFEELLFRGMIQRLLAPWGCWPSIIITSAFFTLLHASFWDLPTVFLLSMIFGYIAVISGSVLPGMLLHFLNNAVAMAMIVTRESLPQGAFRGVWAVLAAVLVISCIAGVLWAKKTGVSPQFAKPFRQAGDQYLPLAWLFAAPLFTAGCMLLVVHFFVKLFI